MADLKTIRRCCIKVLHNIVTKKKKYIYDVTQYGHFEIAVAEELKEISGDVHNPYSATGVVVGGHCWLLDEDKKRFKEVFHTLIREGIIVPGWDDSNQELPFFSLTEYGETYVKEEKIEPKVRVDFWRLVHSKIIEVSKTRFESGHFADSVEASFKEINGIVKDIVKVKTGRELDGSELMNTAFSPKNPLIVLDDLSTESGKNIQLGYMQIFAGSMTGIRNPKAHGNIQISEEEAIRFLFLASLLMYKIDGSKKI